jgi:hypothetical protein
MAKWKEPMTNDPGLPICIRGGLVIGAVDEECQARIITRRGVLWGAWVDDTTYNAEHDLNYYVELTVAKYEPLGLKVMVCVPPGSPHHHYPAPIISVYEAYIYFMGCPPSDWLPIPKFNAYCVQKKWWGTHGTHPPSRAQYLRLLLRVFAHNPKYVLTF